jgi:hypothetical protein
VRSTPLRTRSRMMAKRANKVGRVEEGSGNVLVDLGLSYAVDGFPVERLMTFLTGLGSDIEIRIRKPKRAADRIGRILIEAA